MSRISRLKRLLSCSSIPVQSELHMGPLRWIPASNLPSSILRRCMGFVCIAEVVLYIYILHTVGSSSISHSSKAKQPSGANYTTNESRLKHPNARLRGSLLILLWQSRKGYSSKHRKEASRLRRTVASRPLCAANKRLYQRQTNHQPV